MSAYRLQNVSQPKDFELDQPKADAFLKRLGGLSEVEAKALFHKDVRVCRWNAATQGAILRGISARFTGDLRLRIRFTEAAIGLAWKQRRAARDYIRELVGKLRLDRAEYQKRTKSI